MAANIGEIDIKVRSRIQDTDGRLDPPDRHDAIRSAREEYEKIRPRRRVAEVAGDGGFDYPVAALAGFVDGFSLVTEVWFLYVGTQPVSPRLDDLRWSVVLLPSGVFLRFFDLRPTAAQRFLAAYTTPHTVDEDACTTPSSDDEGLADLAASLCCLKLAAYYEQTTDGTMQADSVDRPTRADSYRSQARILRSTYAAKMEIGTAQTAGLAIANINPPFSSRRHGAGLLFHEN